MVARAFVERSCGFFRTGDCGLSMEQDLSQQRLALALGNVEEGTLSKCPMRWHNPPFLHLLTPSPVGRAGGVLKSCHDGFWGSWFSMPGPVSIQGDCQGQAQLWQWPSGQRWGWSATWGPCPIMRHLGGVQALGNKVALRGFPEAWALCNLSEFYSAAQALY